MAESVTYPQRWDDFLFPNLLLLLPSLQVLVHPSELLCPLGPCPCLASPAQNSSTVAARSFVSQRFPLDYSLKLLHQSCDICYRNLRELQSQEDYLQLVLWFREAFFPIHPGMFKH